MGERTILITAPSLDTKHNVSGISSITNFIIANNTTYGYKHFELGRKDNEKRNLVWGIKMTALFFKWMLQVLSGKNKLVHFNFALSKASVVRDAPLILFAKLVRKKLVIHLHGGDFLTNTNTPAWMKRVLKSVFSGNMPVIVLSDKEKELVTERYAVSNVQVLPNCTDLSEAGNFKRDNYYGEVLNILFLGRISHTKGIDHIYDIVSALKQQNLPFRFYMAGTGPDEEKYCNMFTALLGTDFVFKGVVSGKEKDALLKDCHIFLLPSLFEGLPMSLLESMAFGMVPVVTAVGSIGKVVSNGENGFITGLNEEVAEIMTGEIARLITDRELLLRLSKEAAACIYKNYNPEEYIVQLNRIYQAA